MWEIIISAVGYSSLGFLELVFPKLKWALIRPAISWLYTATILATGAPTVFKFLAIPHALVSLMYIGMFRNDIAQRYLHFPLLGSIVGYLIARWGMPQTERITSAAVIVLLLHLHRIAIAVVRSMIFPAPLIGQFVDIDQARAALVNSQPNAALSLIDTPSGHLIDTMVYRNPITPPPNTWIIYIGGNGEVYEHSGHTAITIAQSLKANALCFNFRGVGRSTGSILRGSDLVDDAKTVIEYLLAKVDPSTSERRIVLYTHSIGAGVGAQVVVKHFPDASIVADRSFSSLADAARSFVRPLRQYPGFVQWAVEHAFGDLNTGEVWDKIRHRRKLVTFHRGDHIIPYSSASLARFARFQEGGANAGEVIELTGAVGDPHNVPSYLLNGHRDVVARMVDFLHGRTLSE